MIIIDNSPMHNKPIYEEISSKLKTIYSRDKREIKVKILDTNVLLSDPYYLIEKGFSPDGDSIALIVPYEVQKELDSVKKDRRIGNASREFSSNLLKIIESENIKELYDKGIIKKPNGSYFIFLENRIHPDYNIPLDSETDKSLINLARIITKISEEHGIVHDTEIVSYDLNLVFQARIRGLKANSWKQRDLLSVYPKGWHIITTSYDEIKNISQKSFIDGEYFKDIKKELGNIFPNEFLVLVPEGLSIDEIINKYDKELNKLKKEFRLIRYLGDDKYFSGTFYDFIDIFYKNAKDKATINSLKIKPLDIFQDMAMMLFFDKNVDLVFLAGSQGTGKTTLAFVSAYAQTIPYGQRADRKHNNIKKYSRIGLIRPPIETRERGQSNIGALPGSLEEKLEPYFAPFYDVIHKFYMSNEEEIKALIEKIPINFVRGRDYSNMIVIIDESQNTSRKILKDALTRFGENCKRIVLGDPNQVDYIFDRFHNGLWESVNRIFDPKNIENQNHKRKKIASIFIPPLDKNPRGDLVAYLVKVL